MQKKIMIMGLFHDSGVHGKSTQYHGFDDFNTGTEGIAGHAMNESQH